MTKEKFICMALECSEQVERHPFNFETGFCPKCEEERNEIILSQIL